MPKCNACAIPIKLLELLLPAIHTWAINTIPMSLIYSVPNIIQSRLLTHKLNKLDNLRSIASETVIALTYQVKVQRSAHGT